MSYSNQTTHYGLPLPTASDRSVWTDNNTAFEAIDGAIYTASQNATGASEAVTAMATTVTGHTASIATLNADVATLSTSVAGLETDLDTAEGNISTINTTLSSIESAIDTLETKVNNVQVVGTTAESFEGVTITAGGTYAFDVPIPTGHVNCLPLYARSSDTTRLLTPINMYASGTVLRIIMANISANAYTNISPTIIVTYAHR